MHGLYYNWGLPCTISGTGEPIRSHIAFYSDTVISGLQVGLLLTSLPSRTHLPPKGKVKTSPFRVKTLLHFPSHRCKIAVTKLQKQKAGRGEFAAPHVPMQEATLSPSPTQQNYSAPNVHYNGFPQNNQWGKFCGRCA